MVSHAPARQPDVKPYFLTPSPNTPPEPISRIDYDIALNAAQLDVVFSLNGPLLVIAGAGSGKTQTLVYRVARLIEQGVHPAHILLLTFTRKAAQEMLQRVGVLVGEQSDHVRGGTFHSVGNVLLRRYGQMIGLDARFTIMDRSDAEDVVHLLRNEYGLHEKGRRVPRKNTIAEMFSKTVNTLRPLDDIVLGDYPHFVELIDDLRHLQRAYRNYKVKHSLVDFDDLLVKFDEVLDSDAALQREISSLFHYMLVDEYQDTNFLQARILQKLASAHNNIMAVGDEAQSIYSFRGATFRNIMDFPNQFPGTRVMKLEENYRSTQPILNLANEVIRGAEESYDKRLFSRREDGAMPVLVRAEDENAQSRFVAQRILELREEGTGLNDIAVLVRSSYQAFDLEIELGKRGIPFVKRGGMRLMETAHVKDLLAHLRVVENPHDAVSWNRILMLIEGIGPKRSMQLVAQVVQETAPGPWLADKAQRMRSTGLSEFAACMERLHEMAASSPADLLSLASTYYLPILKQRYDDYPKRIRDLDHIQAIAHRYELLQVFLSDLTLEPPNESIADVEGEPFDDERLIVSTIHSAKGLEWSCVFLLWLLDGKFPSSYSIFSNQELEEERRLFYVAMTRAKHLLYLNYPINIYDRQAGAVLSRPSRFLDDVPATLLDSWVLVDGGTSAYGVND